MDYNKAITDLGFTLKSTFVPLLLSRNAKDAYKDCFSFSMNYTVEIMYEGQVVFQSEYSMGIGNLPEYKFNDHSQWHFDAIKSRCETGRKAGKRDPRLPAVGSKILYPTIDDVMYSAITDVDILDYRDFEDWAGCVGFDTDSRSAESIYNTCLAAAVLWNYHVPSEVFSKLRVLMEDF